MPKTDLPSPPRHLTRTSADWWRLVVAEFALEPWQLRTLQAAAEAWDLAQGAREQVATDGMMILTRFGEKKAHPMIAVERDSRTAYLRALRELALDVPPPDARPSRRGGQRW